MGNSDTITGSIIAVAGVIIGAVLGYLFSILSTRHTQVHQMNLLRLERLYHPFEVIDLHMDNVVGCTFIDLSLNQKEEILSLVVKNIIYADASGRQAIRDFEYQCDMLGLDSNDDDASANIDPAFDKMRNVLHKECLKLRRKCHLPR